MTTKLRWMTIVVLAMLLSTGPAVALDGARDDDAPGVLAWVIQPLEAVWAWVLGDSEPPSTEVSAIRQLNDEEEGENAPPPPLDETGAILEPGG